MNICTLCWIPTKAGKMNALFDMPVIRNIKKFIRCDIGPRHICFDCYIRAGSISHMIDWVFSKRQLVNRQTHIRYNCCYLCYDLEQVASLQKREDGFVNFILFKLTKHSFINKPVFVCEDCKQLIFAVCYLMRLFYKAVATKTHGPEKAVVP